MKKSTAEALDIYDPELKCHVVDLLTCHGPLSFRQLRLFVNESFPVGALMPTLQEMLTEDKIELNKDGYWSVRQSGIVSASGSQSTSV